MSKDTQTQTHQGSSIVPPVSQRWGLFERERGARKWVRIYPALFAHSREGAAIMFQDYMLGTALTNGMETEIRRIPA